MMHGSENMSYKTEYTSVEIRLYDTENQQTPITYNYTIPKQDKQEVHLVKV